MAVNYEIYSDKELHDLGLQRKVVSADRYCPRLPREMYVSRFESDLQNLTQSGVVWSALDPRRREFRILEVLPGSGDDNIQAVMRKASLPLPVLYMSQRLLADSLHEEFLALNDTKDPEFAAVEWLENCRERVRKTLGYIREYLNNNFPYKSVATDAMVLRWADWRDLDEAFISEQVQELCVYLDAILELYGKAIARRDRFSREIDPQHGASIRAQTLNMINANYAILAGFREEIHDIRNHYSLCLTNAVSQSPLHVPLPNFEATSYCCGDVSQKSMIATNGVERQFPNTAVEVVRRFRLRHKPRFLWLDAICIHQSDKKEKAAQVKMMGEIYCCASQTLGWLGEATADTQKAVFLCQELAPYIHTSLDGGIKAYSIGRGDDAVDMLPSRFADESVFIKSPVTEANCRDVSAETLEAVLAHLRAVLSSEVNAESQQSGVTNSSAREQSVKIIETELRTRRSGRSPIHANESPQAFVSGLLPVLESSRCAIYVNSKGLAWYRDALLSLPSILAKRWFTRLWMYQEMANSYRLLCHIGPDACYLNDIIAVLHWLNSESWANGGLLKAEFQQICVFKYGLADIRQLMHRLLTLESRVTRDLVYGTSRSNLTDRIQRLLKDVTDPRMHKFEPLSLCQLALQSLTLGASMSHDRIYALLSMTSWAQKLKDIPADLEVDYEQDVVCCICRATVAMIKETQDLSVFYYLPTWSNLTGWNRLVTYNVEPWPSWCPRWDLSLAKHTTYHNSGWNPKQMDDNDRDPVARMITSASPEQRHILDNMLVDTPSRGNILGAIATMPPHTRGPVVDGIRKLDLANLIRHNDPRFLYLEGFQLDDIKCIAHLHHLRFAIRSSKEDSNLATAVQALEPHLSEVFAELQEPHGTDTDWLSRMIEVLTIGEYTIKESIAGIEVLAKEEKDHKKDQSTFRSLYDCIERQILHKVMFVTASGYLGLGTKDTQTGDFVAIVFGSSWPIVLRRRACDQTADTISCLAVGQASTESAVPGTFTRIKSLEELDTSLSTFVVG